MQMTPEQFHRRHTKQWLVDRDSRVGVSVEDCWFCGRNRAVCKTKTVFWTLQEALDACDGMNFPGRERLVVSYGTCPWLPEQHWHLTTARRTTDRRRARKRMAKKIRLDFEANPQIRSTPRVLP